MINGIFVPQYFHMFGDSMYAYYDFTTPVMPYAVRLSYLNFFAEQTHVHTDIHIRQK